MNNINRREVDKLRSLFASSKSKAYTERDLRFVVDSDLVLETLLEEHGTVDKAFYGGQKLLAARSSLKVTDIAQIDYPLEFHLFSCMFTDGYDRKGNPILWMRLGLPLPTANVIDIFLNYIIWRLECIIRQANLDGRKVTAVLDCDGLTISYSFIKKIAFTCRKVFPFGLASDLYFLNLGPTLSCFLMVMKYVLPRSLKESIRVVNEDTLEEYIDRDNYPDYLGGPISSIPREIAETSSKMERLSSSYLGSEDNVIKKFLEHLQVSDKLIDEGIIYFQDLKQYVIDSQDKL